MKKWAVLLLVALAAAGSIAWAKRAPLLTRYYVYRLATASERDREGWVARVVAQDAAAVPVLLQCMQQDGREACSNSGQALLALAERWGHADPRSAELVGRLPGTFGASAGAGRDCVLALTADLLRSAATKGAPPRALVQAATQILARATEGEGAARGSAVQLGAVLLAHTGDREVVTSCRKLAGALLHDADAENRLAAVRLVLSPRMDMLPQVVPLLDDPDPKVRCAALVAVGNAERVVATDDLLRWLHDPDADVRRLCESALRARGLTPSHVRLGRLLTDRRPAVRLQILAHLRETDVEPGVWLRRLSHDPDPAVRTAAVRAAAEQQLVDLTDRIEQISRNDPNPTVRQVARYYLSCQKSRALEPQAN